MKIIFFTHDDFNSHQLFINKFSTLKITHANLEKNEKVKIANEIIHFIDENKNLTTEDKITLLNIVITDQFFSRTSFLANGINTLFANHCTGNNTEPLFKTKCQTIFVCYKNQLENSMKYDVLRI